MKVGPIERCMGGGGSATRSATSGAAPATAARRGGRGRRGEPAATRSEAWGDYGAFKSRRVEKNVARVDALQFPVLEFDQDDARQARARELTLVTLTAPPNFGEYEA